MRLRLLAAVAVVGAALLAPSAAFADPSAPVLDQPASPVGTAPIHLTFTDVTGEDGYRVFRGDAGCTNFFETTSVGGPLAPDSTSYDDLSPLEGAHCYYVEAYAGLATADSNTVIVTFDALPPTVTYAGPANGSYVSGALVSVSAHASDAGTGITSVEFFAQGAGVPVSLGLGTNTSGDTYSVPWNTTTGFPDRDYSVWAVATDGMSRTTQSTPSATVHVDNTQPGVTLTGVDAGTSVRGTLNLTSVPTDTGSGVASVSFWYRSLPGGTFQQIGPVVNAPGPYTASLDTTGLTTGTHYEFRAVATDLVGNSDVATVTNVLVDNALPTVTLGGVTASTSVSGTLNLTSAPTDADSGMGTVTFWYRSLPGGTFQQIGPVVNAPGPYAASFATTGVPGGSYEFQAVATDVAGNSKVATVTSVLVDNVLPTGGITSPAAAANLRGSLSVDATASDASSGVDKVDFQSSPAGANTWTTFDTDNNNNALAYHGLLDTTTLAGDGLYDLRIRITDLAGNPASSLTVAGVRVDNTRPTVPGTPSGFAAVQAAPAITFAASTDPAVGGSASGVDHYNVLRNGNPAGVVLAPATSFTDTASLANGFYTYTVVAVDKAGNSSLTPSGGFQILLDAGALSAPTSVTALATPTNQRPQVSWVPPLSAPFLDHYDVYRDSNPTRVGFAAANSTTFTDLSGTLTDGLHTYQVVAADLSDTTFGVASGAVTILYDTTAPAAPGGVAASAALDGSIGINWLAASDGSGSGVARYVVRRSLSSTPPASVADGDATCQGTATSCTDSTALNGKLYSYAVFAVDNAGNVSLAGVTPAVTARDQLAPAAPKGLSATPADASVALKWAAAGPEDDVAGYVLVAKQGLKGPVNETDGTRVCAAIVATSTNCIATGLANGATYTFGLFALDEALNRSLPAVVTSAPNGKVTDTKAPAAVSKLKAHVSGHKVTLTWKNPADDDFDHVEITAGQRKPAALKASKRVYSGRGTKATTTLAAGQSRWFVVVAYDAVGNASQPASVHVVIKAASKFGPAPRAKVHGKVRLSWPVAKGAKYYNVQVYAGKTRILISWPAGRVLQLPRAKLKRGTTYTWYVWPGLGAKAKAHYGKLIGKNAFTFTG